MAFKGKSKSLADKINSLISAKPTFGSDDELDDTKAKVVERYDESDNSDSDFRQSKIRKQNVDLLDEIDKRYEGTKVSRKDVFDMDGDAVDSEDNDSVEREGSVEDDEDLGNDSDDLMDTDNDGEDSDQESGDSNEDSYEDEDEDDCDIGKYENEKAETNFKTMSETNVTADVEKGNCVRSQLKAWENFLEMRIRLQKCVVTSNQMPQYDTHKTLRSDVEFTKKTNETKNKLTMLLDKMLQLQSALLQQYPETRNLTSRKRKLNEEDKDNNSDDSMDEEIPSDTDEEINNDQDSHSEEEKTTETKPPPPKKMRFADYEKVLKERHDSYVDYRNSVIQKWNDKTRIATGAVNKGTNQTALKQIEFVLNDKSKLRKKTQLKRSEYVIVGKSISEEDEVDDGRRIQEYDTEIYDDDDFYHQLLRDLIEFKSSDVTDSIQLSKQWIQLQNMRRRLKRKIDTKATKGRRIRYAVHNKLVNFMAPITVFDTWSDTAKNELYNSLFGKIKPVEEQAGH